MNKRKIAPRSLPEEAGRSASPADLVKEIRRFEEENVSLLSALRVFEMSTAEYEDALRALNPPVIFTTASTPLVSREGTDAFME